MVGAEAPVAPGHLMQSKHVAEPAHGVLPVILCGPSGPASAPWLGPVPVWCSLLLAVSPADQTPQGWATEDPKTAHNNHVGLPTPQAQGDRTYHPL